MGMEPSRLKKSPFEVHFPEIGRSNQGQGNRDLGIFWRIVSTEIAK